MRRASLFGRKKSGPLRILANKDVSLTLALGSKAVFAEGKPEEGKWTSLA
jgi:hypothetical protein